MIRDNETEVCGQPKTKCMTQALKKFSTKRKFESILPCECKPACEQIKYSSQASSTSFEYENTFEAYAADLEGEFPKAIMSRLSVFVEGDYYEPKLTVPVDEIMAKNNNLHEEG